MLSPWRTLGLAGLAAATLVVAACGSGNSNPSDAGPSGLDPSRPTTTITLPDGAEITAEVVLTSGEQSQGMMFRPHLRPTEGMLFPFSEMAPRGFWMFQTVIPLDIIWLDDSKRVVEVSARTPPCRTSDPSGCPTYGGSVNAVYVLELASGQIAAHGIELGSELRF